MENTRIQLSEDEIYKPGTSPAIQDLSRESGLPQSEVASIHAQCEQQAEDEIAKDPKKLVMDIFGNCRLGDKVWDMTRAKVLHPEETTDEENSELDDVLGSMETMFSPNTETQTSVIDNNALGFSDADMALTQSVADSAAADYGIGDTGVDFGTDTFTAVDNSIDANSVNSTPDTPAPEGGAESVTPENTEPGAEETPTEPAKDEKEVTP